jgi:hypothetical protein
MNGYPCHSWAFMTHVQFIHRANIARVPQKCSLVILASRITSASHFSGLGRGTHRVNNNKNIPSIPFHASFVSEAKDTWSEQRHGGTAMMSMMMIRNVTVV